MTLLPNREHLLSTFNMTSPNASSRSHEGKVYLPLNCSEHGRIKLSDEGEAILKCTDAAQSEGHAVLRELEFVRTENLCFECAQKEEFHDRHLPGAYYSLPPNQERADESLAGPLASNASGSVKGLHQSNAAPGSWPSEGKGKEKEKPQIHCNDPKALSEIDTKEHDKGHMVPKPTIKPPSYSTNDSITALAESEDAQQQPAAGDTFDDAYITAPNLEQQGQAMRDSLDAMVLAMQMDSRRGPVDGPKTAVIASDGSLIASDNSGNIYIHSDGDDQFHAIRGTLEWRIVHSRASGEVAALGGVMPAGGRFFAGPITPTFGARPTTPTEAEGGYHIHFHESGPRISNYINGHVTMKPPRHGTSSGRRK